MRIPFCRVYNRANELVNDLNQLQTYVQTHLHAKRKSSWDRMKFTLHKPTDKSSGVTNDLYTIDFPNINDAHEFLLLDKEIIEVDTAFKDMLMTKLVRFAPKSSAFIEGDTFELGDFVIRLGSLSVMNQKKALVIDIEYCPSLHAYQCEKPLINEFMNMFIDTSSSAPSTTTIAESMSLIQKPKLPELLSVDIDFSKFNNLPHDKYSIRHLIVQYVYLLNKVVGFSGS